MDLRRLTQNTGCRLLRGDALTEITSVCCDSRCAGPGALFVCLPGRHADGHDFAAQAVAAGAAAVLCTHDVPGLPAGRAVLLAGDPRRAMAALAARLYGEPARAMTMIGVTGTKGKTTTAHLLAAVLQADGRRVGLVGTNGVCWPGHRHDLNHTTPESCDLQLLLRRMADDGCDTCVMEVSSLGLKFDRAAEIEFAVGVFTNLSPDHIGPDEHADFAEYLFWKRALFRRCRVGVFNNDDPHVGKIMQGLPCRAVTYGIGCPADVRADADFALTRAGGRLGAAFTVDGARYAVGMPGAFSVYNALAALTAARVRTRSMPGWPGPSCAGGSSRCRWTRRSRWSSTTPTTRPPPSACCARCGPTARRGLSRCSAAAARAAACAGSAWGRSAHGWRISASSPRITAAANPWSTF